jgi:hypothetical protein
MLNYTLRDIPRVNITQRAQSVHDKKLNKTFFY